MKKTDIKNSQAGFSLLELLIVTTVMLIIMAASFTLLRGTIVTANNNYQITTAAQGLRNSHEFLTRDILVVGDGLKGLSGIRLPTVFVNKFLTIRPITDLDPTNIGFVSIGSIISDTNIPANVGIVNSVPANNIMPRTDRPTMLSIDQSFASIDIPVGAVNFNLGNINIPAARINNFKVGELYFITGGGTGVMGTVTAVNPITNQIIWGVGDPLGLNSYGLTGALGIGTNAGKNAVSLKRLNMIQYFVDADGKLIRRAFGVQNVAFVDSVIAEHVIDFRINYILNPSPDNKIFEQPKRDLDLEDASLVRMIQPTVAVETAYPLQDGQKDRVDGTILIGVRNLQFLEAPVPVDALGNTKP